MTGGTGRAKGVFCLTGRLGIGRRGLGGAGVGTGIGSGVVGHGIGWVGVAEVLGIGVSVHGAVLVYVVLVSLGAHFLKLLLLHRGQHTVSGDRSFLLQGQSEGLQLLIQRLDSGIISGRLAQLPELLFFLLQGLQFRLVILAELGPGCIPALTLFRGQVDVLRGFVIGQFLAVRVNGLLVLGHSLWWPQDQTQ